MTKALFASSLLAALVASAGALPAATEGFNAGALTCETSATIAAILLQRQDMRCTFYPIDGGPVETYRGRIDAYGFAVGAVARGKLAWAVLAHSVPVAPGSLGGSFSGLAVQASLGGGGGANLLVGDNNNQISLQPLSLEGHVGANALVGVARVTLIPAPERRPRRFWDRWDD